MLKADQLKALSVRSDGRGLVRLAGHLGALCVTGALVLHARGLWLVPAIVVHGYVLIFLFCALHEATHHTPFRSRWLGTAVGHFAGFLLLLPFEYFRLFHWDHHRFTQDPLGDPELARPKPASVGAYLFHLSGLPNWGVRIATSAKHALTARVPQPWIPAGAHPMIVLEARLYAAAYIAMIAISIALDSTVLVWLWVLPALVGQLFLRPYLLAEHTGCEMSPDTLANTRTTHTNAVVRFFAWNMPYHVEHHAYPAIPFHSLPHAHEFLRGKARTVSPGYLSASRSIFQHLVHHAPARSSAAARTESKTS